MEKIKQAILQANGSNQKENRSTFQLIVFKQKGEEYAINIDQIKEVVITPPITKMPQTLPYIKGVANIRGNVISVIDLEELFELKKNTKLDTHQQNYTLVVDSDEYKFGVLVQEVPNTLTVTSDEIEKSPNIIHSGNQSDYIKGVITLENRMIILIDIIQVIGGESTNNVFTGT
ncbi:chemotaxis protein CheW [Rapidithrix thailandica]|uniref:Chemotaxis protein CheW n=1 Tax=Rapidithrix thailandica TaxID=413964 RepID=A0AAW9SCB5_9BACT